MIPDLLSAFPHRQFHTLPGLLDSWAALPNSYPNACMPMQGGSLYHFYDGLWYDPAERRTHDLPSERRTRYRLSQPDTVYDFKKTLIHNRATITHLTVYSLLPCFHCSVNPALKQALDNSEGLAASSVREKNDCEKYFQKLRYRDLHHVWLYETK